MFFVFMVEIRNTELHKLAAKVASLGGGRISQSVRFALEDIADSIKNDWADLLSGKPSLKATNSLNRSLENAYERLQTEINEHGLKVFSVDKKVIEIENGRNAHDMKTTHPNGPKSRLNKKGESYNIIPFQKSQSQTTKTPIPKPIQKVIRREIDRGWHGTENLGKESNYFSPNASGIMVERKRYNWGRRLDLNPNPFSDKTRKYTGLYRIPDKPFIGKTGEAKTANYGIISFRIIKENQPAKKWIIPAKAGHHFTKEIAMAVGGKHIRFIKNVMQQQLFLGRIQ